MSIVASRPCSVSTTKLLPLGNAQGITDSIVMVQKWELR